MHLVLAVDPAVILGYLALQPALALACVTCYRHLGKVRIAL